MLRAAAFQLRREVSLRFRLAELLSAGRSRKCGDAARHEPRNGPHRSHLQPLRCAPGSRLRRWSQAHGPPFLYQFRRIASGRKEEITRSLLLGSQFGLALFPGPLGISNTFSSAAFKSRVLKSKV